MHTRSTILWQRLDLPGHEIAAIVRDGDAVRITGVALFAHEGRPCRLEYAVECDGAWRTRSVSILGSIGEQPAALELVRSPQGEWRANDVLHSAVSGCIDVDLEFSPCTNLLPIRRLGLAIGATQSVRVAWVRFPNLTLELFEQRYTRLDATTYRFESADGEFRRDLVVDAEGLVLEYPDFWLAEATTNSGSQKPGRDAY